MRMTVHPAIAVTLPVVLLLLSSPACPADLYWSNAVGIQGELLRSDEPDPPAYILEVSTSGGAEVRRLLNSGQEIRRTEIVRDGTTATERTYEESHYSEGALTERWEFGYHRDLLTTREVFGPTDALIYRETYSYWRDGTLRSIVKEEQSEVRTGYRYRDGRLEEEWISRPGEAERFEFDSAGRLAIRERFADEDLIEQEVRLYWASDSGSLLKEVIVSAGDEITRRGYDDRGRLTSERVEESGLLVRELVRTFGDDFLIGEEEVDGEGRRRWEYEYTTDGERERETYFEDDDLVEISHLILGPEQSPADRMVELFNRGKAVLRVYYEGQLRVMEEVIRDSEVIRTREFSRSAAADAEDGGQ